MTQITATPATIEFLKKQRKFSTHWHDGRINSQTELFDTLEEATQQYAKLDVMDFSHVGSRYWYNNTEGQSAELRELKELPIILIAELNEAETEEEMNEIYHYDDVHHTHSERIETKYSYLSDEWDETLGKDGKFVIKQATTPGIIYGTHFGEIEMVSISELLK